MPAYLPRMKPIEMVRAKPKMLPPKGAARCADTLCRTISSPLSAFTPQDCAPDFRHAGYASM